MRTILIKYFGKQNIKEFENFKSKSTMITIIFYYYYYCFSVDMFYH
jgi:hypothetical protein